MAAGGDPWLYSIQAVATPTMADSPHLRAIRAAERLALRRTSLPKLRTPASLFSVPKIQDSFALPIATECTLAITLSQIIYIGQR